MGQHFFFQTRRKQAMGVPNSAHLLVNYLSFISYIFKPLNFNYCIIKLTECVIIIISQTFKLNSTNQNNVSPMQTKPETTQKFYLHPYLIGYIHIFRWTGLSQEKNGHSQTKKALMCSPLCICSYADSLFFYLMV